MTVVVDASTVVAALIDSGPDGRWAETFLTADLFAPPLLYVEATNVLRRAVAAGSLTDDIAALANAELLELRIGLVDYATVATRIWALRHNVTAYDAWYVAVAELVDAPLATLDQRLATSPGPTCTFWTPATHP